MPNYIDTAVTHRRVPRTEVAGAPQPVYLVRLASGRYRPTDNPADGVLAAFAPHPVRGSLGVTETLLDPTIVTPYRIGTRILF